MLFDVTSLQFQRFSLKTALTWEVKEGEPFYSKNFGDANPVRNLNGEFVMDKRSTKYPYILFLVLRGKLSYNSRIA